MEGLSKPSLVLVMPQLLVQQLRYYIIHTNMTMF